MFFNSALRYKIHCTFDQMLRMFRLCFLLFLLMTFLFSCRKLDRFEKNVSIPGYQWKQSFEPEISFEITDTVSMYQSFLVLRHTHAYAYRNIWLQLSFRQPGDSIFRAEKFELNLQQSDGQWLGTGLSDIWELRHPLFSDIRFRQPGIYTIRIKQIMRDNPLSEVMSAGIRIEKMQP